MAIDNIELLQAKLVRLRERERASRMEASKIVREMAQMDRKREAQMLITLGRAWIALGERSSDSTRASMQRFLDGYISRETDREVLKSTPWAVNAPTALIAPAHGPEVAYESDDSQY